MGTFHSIFTELGIDNPVMHPDREPGYETGWMVDEAFEPIIGKTYQIAFGRLPFGREMRNVVRTVRIDGPEPEQWFDVDEGKRLEKGLNLNSIKAFRQLA
ncbi:hypothetical protein EGT07_04200 [Herbaspirillum sp. HC18]|nr:hypothetical protein EGT07_04200 [Herbaspirillum sp. HC18]